MKKGYTLIELMATIVIIGIVSLITGTIVANIVRDSKKDAFKDSVLIAINSYANREAGNLYVEVGELDIKDLVQKETSLKSGKVKRLDDNVIVAVNITDGNYCANGPKNNLVITEGKCEE